MHQKRIEAKKKNFMKIVYREGEESKRYSNIGESERAFFRALVDVNGLYPKDPHVTITEVIENYGDFTVKAEKNGTVAIVSIKINLAQEKKKESENSGTVLFDLAIEGEDSSAAVSVAVIKDQGSLQEIVQTCLFEAKKRLSVPNVSEVFGKKQSVSYDIFRQKKTEREAEKTLTYGTVREKFYISPILQEQSSADAVITVTSCGRQISRVGIEKGEVLPSVLQKVLAFHLRQ